MNPEKHAQPRLAAGWRVSAPNRTPRVVQMPEHALRLNGPSSESVERCAGTRTVQQIIAELQKIYSKAEPERVEKDILAYLALLHEQGALEFTAEDAAAQK